MGPPILLAEDDAAQAIIVQRVLRAARLANPVRLSVDGEDAWAYLEGAGEYADRTRHPTPVLVLLDLHLPGRSGLEVLASIRDRSQFSAIPVIVMSASTDAGPIRQAMDLGATSYLVKPVAFDALIETLRGLDLPWAIVPPEDARG